MKNKVLDIQCKVHSRNVPTHPLVYSLLYEHAHPCLSVFGVNEMKQILYIIPCMLENMCLLCITLYKCNNRTEAAALADRFFQVPAVVPLLEPDDGE